MRNELLRPEAAIGLKPSVQFSVFGQEGGSSLGGAALRCGQAAAFGRGAGWRMTWQNRDVLRGCAERVSAAAKNFAGDGE